MDGRTSTADRDKAASQYHLDAHLSLRCQPPWTVPYSVFSLLPQNMQAEMILW